MTLSSFFIGNCSCYVCLILVIFTGLILHGYKIIAFKNFTYGWYPGSSVWLISLADIRPSPSMLLQRQICLFKWLSSISHCVCEYISQYLLSIHLLIDNSLKLLYLSSWNNCRRAPRCVVSSNLCVCILNDVLLRMELIVTWFSFSFFLFWETHINCSKWQH